MPASGMAAISVALAAIVRAGHRVVRAQPDLAQYRQCRAAARARWWTRSDLIAQPDGGFRLDLDRLDTMMAGARAFILNSPDNPTGWTATRGRVAGHPGHGAPARGVADLRRSVFPAGL